MGELFKQGPAVVIDAMVLQHKQLADVPGSDVTGNLHRSAGVGLIVHFDNLGRGTGTYTQSATTSETLKLL